MGYDVESWSEFFVATAGATAALTGLLFVAVSINLERILSLPGVIDRALGALVLLLGALLVAILALAPGQSDLAVGLEIAGVSGAAAAVVGRLAMRIQADQRAHLIGVAVFSFWGTVPFVVGGLSLAEGSGGGLYWVLIGTVGAIAGAVSNAWVLLIEVLR